MDKLPYKILIVEDDPAVMSLITDAFKSGSHRIFAAFTIEEARENLKKNRPDLLILDRMLPDGDGLELCAEIRKDPAISVTAPAHADGQSRTQR